MEQTDWVMTLRDGTSIRVPPDKVAAIIRKIENKEPIRTEGRLVLYQDIQSGPQIYTPPQAERGLAEDAAQVWDEPIINDDGEVVVIWVKEAVSVNSWNKYYSQFANYYKLGNHYDSVLIAYRIPVHKYVNSVEKCTTMEQDRLEKMLTNQ